jgi:preprotein translocase subunit SecG
MSLLIGILSFVLVIICLFLGLLILIQLPKKEAGMGTAFGGDAAVAMFGAGTGNALTKMTKYAAGAFLILCLVLAVLNSQASKSRTKGLRDELNKANAAAATPAVAPAMNLTTPATNAVPSASSTVTNAVTPPK